MLGNLIRPTRSLSPGQISWPDYTHMWEQFGFNSTTYMVPNGALNSLTALQAMRNPIVQAAMVLRMMCLSEMRFAMRPKLGKKGARDLFWSEALDILDNPYPGAVRGELVSRMSLDADLYGNSYWYRSAPNQLTWIDPTKMKILTGDQHGPSGANCGKVLLAYQVQDKSGNPEETFLPNEIVHYKPIPDPDHAFRGLSWLSALLPDIVADQDMTTFKHSFLQNAATPNLVVQFTSNIGEDAFKQFKERMDSAHTGPAQGFKTLYLGAGADVKVVGSNFADLNLQDNQGYGETRLAVASGVPASLLGIAEGMKGATLNTANYAATRRRFSDMTIRPLWTRLAGALEVIVQSGSGNELWYDERGIAFLTADLQDQAAIRTADSTTVLNLTNAGYTPDSVVEAITTADMSVLEHSGMMSIQLKPVAPLATPSDTPPAGGDPNAED